MKAKAAGRRVAFRGRIGRRRTGAEEERRARLRDRRLRNAERKANPPKTVTIPRRTITIISRGVCSIAVTQNRRAYILRARNHTHGGDETEERSPILRKTTNNYNRRLRLTVLYIGRHFVFRLPRDR